MYSLETGIYTADEIRERLMQDRSVWYEYELLDKNRIPIGKVTATGSIDYNATVKIQRTAQLNIIEERDINFASDKIKPVMCLNTPNGIEKFPLGVFFLCSPQRQASNGSILRNIECYDMTLQIIDDKFTTRYKVTAGTLYTVAIQAILSGAGISDAIITASDKTLQSDIEFPVGMEKIDAVNQLLKAINYNNIYANQNGKLVGEPYLNPLLRPVETSYTTDAKSIIFSGVREELDIFKVPNKVVRYLDTADRGTLISEASNTDPTSLVSIPSRGRTIVDIQAVNDIADQATLDAYTTRILEEYKIYQRIIFDTAAMPNHGNLDCLYVIDDELNIAGKYIEEAWHLDLALGGHMQHTARKVISI